MTYGQTFVFHKPDGSYPAQVSTTVNFNVSPAKDKDAIIYFSDAGGVASAFYGHPQALTISNADVVKTDPVNVWQDDYGIFLKDSAMVSAVETEATHNKFVGIHAGTIDPFLNPNVKGTGQKHRIQNSPMVTFCLQYKDASGLYRPYNYMSRVSSYYYADTDTVGPSKPKINYSRPDPRTDRFSAAISSQGLGINIHFNQSYQPAATTGAITAQTNHWQCSSMGFPRGTSGFVYQNGRFLGDWAQNQFQTAGYYAAYTDKDGLFRPGDGFRRDSTSGDGCILYHGDKPTSSSPSISARKPVILNRPFRSVAELGYAYRDQPFKTLDFTSGTSGDSALLDLFSVSDQPEMVAGQINLNTALSTVLRTVLAGASKAEINPTLQISANDATGVANAISQQLLGSNGGPIANRSELANRLSSAVQSGFTASVDKANKTYAEAPVRALSDVANLRTWNLLIDVIAQSGMISPGAKAPPSGKGLADFVVRGEKRYWLHIAIDRFSGKILEQQLEPVYE